MNKTTKSIGNMLAMSVAGLFLGACDNASSATAAPDDATADNQVKCMGINECKGQGLCDTATHDCAGKNECKGKGWIKVKQSECAEQGGTVV